jgi:hypothetical protein
VDVALQPRKPAAETHQFGAKRKTTTQKLFQHTPTKKRKSFIKEQSSMIQVLAG